MRVLHVTQPFGIGGAGIACERLHQALLVSGVGSDVVCEVDAWRSSRVVRLNETIPVMVRAGRAAWERFARHIGVEAEFGPYWMPAGVVPYVRRHDCDVVHLHWFTQRFLSLRELPRIEKPCVWSLHDLWPVSFPHRYPAQPPADAAVASPAEPRDCAPIMTGAVKRVARWIERHRVQFVCLSRWQEQVVRNTPAFSKCLTSVIPNPIDTRRFAPFDKAACRRILGLDDDAFVMVTAANPLTAPAGDRKGGDLLARVLRDAGLRRSFERGRTELVVIGHTAPPGTHDELGSISTRFMGHLADDISLAIIYSAADACVVASRMETFGLVAAEAQSCGCPVVGFASTGTNDVVVHGTTGLLAAPFDCDAFAEAIRVVHDDLSRRRLLATNCRRHVEETMSSAVVARRILELYEQTARSCR